MADTTVSVFNVISLRSIFIAFAVRVGNRSTDVLNLAELFKANAWPESGEL